MVSQLKGRRGGVRMVRTEYVDGGSRGKKLPTVR
jgi:hypothetical protein